MTHRKFMNAMTDGSIAIDGRVSQLKAYNPDKGVWARCGAEKYYPPREWKLLILKRATETEYGLSIHWWGGVAWDKDTKDLVKKKLLREGKPRRYHGALNPNWFVTIRKLYITEKGRKYLERHTK